MRRLLNPSSVAASVEVPSFFYGALPPGLRANSLSSSCFEHCSTIRRPSLISQSGYRSMFTQGATKVLLTQYQQTCETNRAVESGDKKTAMKWMTKSSKEFFTENDKVRASKNPERDRHKSELALEKKASVAHSIRIEKEFQKEVDMLLDSKVRRFRKTFDFFKRQGWAFFVCYVATYLGCFFTFYYILANDIVSKFTIFEMLFVITNGGFDRDEFIKRLEAWDTYINVGFAFILNEMIEVARFPMVMAFFLTFRGTLSRVGRSMKTSMYRRSAPEI